MLEYDALNNVSEESGEVTEACPVVGFQKVDVCVPVTVKPFANIGKVETKCCGKPKVAAGDVYCMGEIDGICHFTISQTLCIEVPVEFGAKTDVGKAHVDCLGASYEKCEDCRDKEEE